MLTANVLVEQWVTEQGLTLRLQDKQVFLSGALILLWRESWHGIDMEEFIGLLRDIKIADDEINCLDNTVRKLLEEGFLQRRFP